MIFWPLPCPCHRWSHFWDPPLPYLVWRHIICNSLNSRRLTKFPHLYELARHQMALSEHWMSLRVYWLSCSMCNVQCFSIELFNLVDTCNIALILFLNVMSQHLGSLAPPLSHNVALRRPPLPLNVWRNLWMVPNHISRFSQKRILKLINTMPVKSRSRRRYKNMNV